MKFRECGPISLLGFVIISLHAASLTCLVACYNSGANVCGLLGYFSAVQFLPRDAMQSAVLPRQVVCLSVCLSVTLKYRDHIGWKCSEIISRLVNLGCSFSEDCNVTDLLRGNILEF